MPLKLSELRTHDQVLAEQQRDPEFRAEWERLTLARAVGECLLHYRTDKGLSQRALALKMGIKQPQVARLEAGAHDPSLSTLRLLSDRLGIEFLIDIGPSSPHRRWMERRPARAILFQEAEFETGTRITVAASAAAR